MDCISVNADGWLEIGGVSTKYLAEKYGHARICDGRGADPEELPRIP